MKKNKFIINQPKKLSMLIPAIAMACALNAHPATLQQQEKENINITRSISASYETLNFEAESKKFTEEKALKNLKSILTSELNDVNVNKSQDEVLAEVKTLLKNMKDDTLDLSRMYKALEAHTVLKSGLCMEDIYENSDYLTTQIDAQHYMHNMLDKLNLLRLGATKNDLIMIHKTYNDKTLSFSIPANGRDMRKETDSTLHAFREDIKAFIFLGHEPKNGMDNHTITSEIEMYLQEIQFATSRINFTESDYKNLVGLINKAAEKLPEEIFGKPSMRRSLIAICTAQASMNELLTNVDYLGYDLKGLIKQENPRLIHSNELTR